MKTYTMVLEITGTLSSGNATDFLFPNIRLSTAVLPEKGKTARLALRGRTPDELYEALCEVYDPEAHLSFYRRKPGIRREEEYAMLKMIVNRYLDNELTFGNLACLNLSILDGTLRCRGIYPVEP